MNRDFDFARTLELIQNFQTAPAAFAFGRVVRIRQQLQFIQNKSRYDERAAKESGRAKIGDATVDDDVGIDHERLMLGHFASEAHIRNDEREFIATAPHRQHHSEIAKKRIHNQTGGPLHGLGLITQNLGRHQQVRENQAK